MIAARVAGTVWGARQSAGLSGRRIVEVIPVCLAGLGPGRSVSDDVEDRHLAPGSLLAVDPLGADVGQIVLVSIGSRVRDLVTHPHVPTKHCVIAIVDRLSVEA